jgi:signal transduction histidine kinase
MPTPSPLLRSLALPAIGAAFLAFWISAEAGRLAAPEAAPALLGMLIPTAIAIALARVHPGIALAIAVAVPVVALLGRFARPDSTTWPVLEGALVVAFACGRWAATSIRWTALLAGAVWASAVGASLVFTGRWLSWTGLGDEWLRPDLTLQWGLKLAGVHAVLWVCAWAVGVALQFARRSEAAAERLDRTERELLIAGYELRAMRERTEIAQEVHDVLAHSLAVVIALADGSRFLRASRPESTDTALQRIAETSRSALGDLRGLIEGLTDDIDRPQPGLAELPALVERIRGTGVAVELRERGAPGGLSPAQELCVHRIVQESLTNVLKHAGEDPRAEVSLTWDGPGLLVTVASRGDDAPVERTAPHRGFGIAGMEHRARLAGGWLTSGPDPDGSFRVTAFLPTADTGTVAAEDAA